MRVVAIVAARMGSTRLPGKVLFPLTDAPVLSWVIRAARAATGIDDVWIATTHERRDDDIVKWAKRLDVPVWRGSEIDVLRRYLDCALTAKADIIVRLTGDCPFLDPEIISMVVALQRATSADYANNVDPPTYPDGLDVQTMTTSALQIADAEATRPTDRDTVCEYIGRDRTRFKQSTLICSIPGLHKERWVLDDADDYRFCAALAKRLPRDKPPSMTQILQVLENAPQLRQMPRSGTRNERFFKAIADE